MEKVNFLLPIYKNIYDESKKKKYNIVLLFLVIIELTMIVKIKKDFDNYSLIKEKVLMQNKTLQKFEERDNLSYLEKNIYNIKILTNLEKDILLHSNYKEILIKDSIILLKLNVGDTSDYLELIRKIENDKKYNILYVSPYSKKNNVYEFTIKMEVSNNCLN